MTEPKPLTREKKGELPAIPPDDYQGTIGDWMVELQAHGFWNGKNPCFYGDVWLTREEYRRLLEACEEND